MSSIKRLLLRECYPLLLIVFLLAVAPVEASPIEIYSSGTVLDPSGVISDPYFPLLRFNLNFDANLSGIAFWVSDTTDGGSAHFLDVQYALYSGASQPVGAPIASGYGNNISYRCPCLTYNFDPNGPGDRWITEGVQFNVTPVDLQAGTDYWLALSWTLDPSGVNQHAVWVASDTGAPAFALNGTPVPEPASMVLLVFGLGSLGYCLRKF